MRGLILLATVTGSGAALGGCSDPATGASIVVDGVAVELPEATALRIDTFFMLSATAADGSTIELGFPVSSDVGPHTCDEGQIAGLVTVTFVASDAKRYSSVYPSSGPAHLCSFEIDERGSQIALSGLAGTLSDMMATSTRVLADGSFRATVTE